MLEIDPRNGEALSCRGQAWLGQHHFDKALEDAEAILRADAHDPNAFYLRALVRDEQNNTQAAVADLSEAIRLGLATAPVYLHRGTCWLTLKQFDRAIADLTESLRFDATTAVAFSLRGHAHEGAGNAQAAVDDYSAALKIESQDVDSLCSRARALNNLGEYQRAIADANDAMKLAPRRVDAWRQRAFARFQREEYALAIDDCTTAIKIDPTNTRVWHLRAGSYLAAGQLDKALEDHLHLAKLDAKYAAAARQMAEIVKQRDNGGGKTPLGTPEKPLRETPDWPAGGALTQALKRFGELADE